jgi:hypothetical protein
MLAPFVFNLLIGSLLLLLAGWASDTIRAGMQGGQTQLNPELAGSWSQMSRPRTRRVYDDPDATWTAPPVRRHQAPGRLASHSRCS